MDGHGPGALRGDAVPRGPARAARTCSTIACPTIVESPPIETFIVEAPDPNGPFGAKEAGEGALSGFLPALTNAIADAIGIELTELPATPDRVLDAVVARRRAARLAASKAARASEEA